MSTTVLARKWRPKKFADIIGQNTTTTILKNIITRNRLHHAYLLTGTRGVGKTTIARIIAKALNCNHIEQGEPCTLCETCLSIDKGRFVDVIEIDAASNTGVDNIREVIENAKYLPTEGKYKIYIIDEVHMLSKPAFNALLKTLEEPPLHIIFILATTDLDKVPITVLSRCLQLKLRNLNPNEISQHLATILNLEHVEFELEALNLLANAAAGSMRDALSLTDQALAFSSDKISLKLCQDMLGVGANEIIYQLLTLVIDQDANGLTKLCQQLHIEGFNLVNILEQINQALFEIAIVKESPQIEAKAEIINLASKLERENCQLYFEISNLGLEQIRKLDKHYPILTMCLLRMIAFRLATKEEHKSLLNNNLNENQANLNTKTPLAEKIAETLPLLKPQTTEELTPQPHENEQISLAIEPKPKKLLKKEPFQLDWLGFINQLDLETLNKDLAVVLRNSSLYQLNANNELSLHLNQRFVSLVKPEIVDKIEELLQNTYQIDFDVSFDFINTEPTTNYKAQKQHEIEQKKQLATEAIYNDPIIQDMLNNFSAKILPNSIKPKKD